MKKEKMKALLDLLLRKTDYVTSEDLAQQFNVSQATVIRWVATINQYYKQLLIISERGSGYKIDYDVYLQNTTVNEFDTEEQRCREVICELLLSAPKAKRLDLVYDKYFVSESVMKKDQQLINKRLARYDLKLERHNRSLAIVGSEKNVRSAIMEIFLNLHKATDINAIELNSKDIDHADFKFAIKQLEFANDVLGKTLQYPYNISFFSHIYVLLDRAKKYQVMTLEEDIKDLKHEERLKNPEIYSVCKQIIDNIVSYLGRKVDENEIYYLFDYLSSARLAQNSEDIILCDITKMITEEYIEQVSHELKITFKINIADELGIHVHYMLERLEKKIFLTNALLDEIALAYREIYEAVLKASTKITQKYALPQITKDESGFIALYFAKYLELDMKKVNAYVICTTGLGTSELLAVKIQQTLPTINIIGMSASDNILQDIAQTPEKIDLLISTVSLKEPTNIPVVLVSAILTARDIALLSNAIGEITNEK